MTAPMDGHDVTLGELARGIIALEARMNLQFDALIGRLDRLEFVPRGEHNLQIKELTDRVVDLEDAKKWMARTLVGAILAPCVVALVLWAVLG